MVMVGEYILELFLTLCNSREDDKGRKDKEENMRRRKNEKGIRGEQKMRRTGAEREKEKRGRG